jgi:tetratricopeptide (TPR) repeat protein
VSVLLEALKKAAAEKKLAQSGLAPSLPSEHPPEDSVQSNNGEVSSSLTNLKLVLSSVAEPASLVSVPPILSEQGQDISSGDMHVSAVELSEEPVSHFKIKPVPVLDENPTAHTEHTQHDNAHIENELSSDTVLQGSDVTVALPVPDSPNTSNTSVESSHDEQPLSPLKLESQSDNSSFDWRMDELPGYAQPSVPKIEHDKNPILVSGAHAFPAKKPYTFTSSSRVIGTLLVVLVFISIGLYGLLYYQEQEAALEQSMKKYALAKRPATVDVVAPVVVEAVSKAPDEMVSNDLQTRPGDGVLNPAVTATDETHGGDTSLGLEEDANVKPIKTTLTTVDKSLSKPVEKQKVITKPKPDDYLAQALQEEKRVTRMDGLALLNSAYSAYDAGDYVAAEQRFKDILSLNPRQTTALIGLGNIAGIRRDLNVAVDYYQQVLMIEPDNLAAFENIAHYASSLDLNSDWSTRLTQMASQYPNSAVLQNALGNQFSKVQDWHSAQQAYFNAVSIEPSNASFLANLAISLDQLGQYSLAATHYTQALALSDQKASSFSQDQIKQRIVVIRQFLGENQ